MGVEGRRHDPLLLNASTAVRRAAALVLAGSRPVHAAALVQFIARDLIRDADRPAWMRLGSATRLRNSLTAELLLVVHLRARHAVAELLGVDGSTWVGAAGAWIR
jgi:hypothetical protein